MDLGPTEATFLTTFRTLSKSYPAELARAAIETAILRGKAREKFTSAHLLYFTREALEQATSEVVARHRARRFGQYESTADLCCGIGGDALALAAAGVQVAAVDTDPLRVAMTEANARVLNLQALIECRVGDALTAQLPEVRAAFADPARRAGGRRYLHPEAYSPPLSAILGRFPSGFPLAVKIAPGVSHADLSSVEPEVEFVSLSGELKECVLWFGPFRSTMRRATVLPSADTLATEILADAPAHTSPRAFLYDPDPAVTRAGLVFALALQLDAQPIDAQVQLLTSDRHVQTPFATAFAIEHSAPFHVRLLRDHLRAQQVGRVTVIKRGSPADADDLLRKLRLSGPNNRTVLLTRIDGWHAMIVCERTERKLE
jgi:hypothetical protein